MNFTHLLFFWRIRLLMDLQFHFYLWHFLELIPDVVLFYIWQILEEDLLLDVLGVGCKLNLLLFVLQPNPLQSFSNIIALEYLGLWPFDRLALSVIEDECPIYFESLGKGQCLVCNQGLMILKEQSFKLIILYFRFKCLINLPILRLRLLYFLYDGFLLEQQVTVIGQIIELINLLIDGISNNVSKLSRLHSKGNTDFFLTLDSDRYGFLSCFSKLEAVDRMNIFIAYHVLWFIWSIFVCHDQASFLYYDDLLSHYIQRLSSNTMMISLYQELDGACRLFGLHTSRIMKQYYQLLTIRLATKFIIISSI